MLGRHGQKLCHNLDVHWMIQTGCAVRNNSGKSSPTGEVVANRWMWGSITVPLLLLNDNLCPIAFAPSYDLAHAFASKVVLRVLGGVLSKWYLPFSSYDSVALSQICPTISSQLRHISTIGKSLLNSNNSPTCPYNRANFSPLAAEICWRVWGTPANFNGFRVLAALLHSTLVVGVSQTLRRWTEGAIYIRQGDHHVGHWPTF